MVRQKIKKSGGGGNNNTSNNILYNPSCYHASLLVKKCNSRSLVSVLAMVVEVRPWCGFLEVFCYVMRSANNTYGEETGIR